MKDNNDFKIGDLIQVGAIAEAQYGSADFDFSSMEEDPLRDKKTIRTKPAPMPLGWYVGFTYLMEGKYVPGDRGKPIDDWNEPPEFEPPYLGELKATRVARVRFHERGKEYKALFGDIEKAPAAATD